MKKNFIFNVIFFLNILVFADNFSENQSFNKKLDKIFLSVQNHAIYYSDSKCRHRLRTWESKQLIRRTENFGKKIFVKSLTAKEIESKLELFGKIIGTREFNYLPEEIANGIAKYIDSKVKKLKITKEEKKDFDNWFIKFKRWGLSYFCFSDRNQIKIVDCQNGNYFLLGKKGFFIEEKYQKLIDIVFSYKEKKKMTDKEKKLKRKKLKYKFKDLNEKYLRNKSRI